VRRFRSEIDRLNRRLDAAAGKEGPCPSCPAGPVLIGSTEDRPCPQCGHPPAARFLEVVIESREHLAAALADAAAAGVEVLRPPYGCGG
jgi:hypothetical protein